ncbi:MAG: MGMT family protein [Cyanobacteria bacterium P01_C01_bin.72]
MTQPYVQNLFLKQEHKEEMLPVSHLNLRNDLGIVGDINSDRLSPRQILLVCSADLARFSLMPGELRENIILDTADIAKFKPGAKLTFPSGAEIRLTFYCEPCQRVAHLVDSIKSFQQKRGILGVVKTGGAIAIQDQVTIEPNYFPALSEIPYERFLDYVDKIPRGKVVSYKQILKCIGVDRSYFRAIPIYLKKAPANYPLHRVLDSQGRVTPHTWQQVERLSAEGIKVKQQANFFTVSLEEYAWQHSAIY